MVTVKQFPIFDNFTFNGLVYRDLTGIKDGDMIRSAYEIMAKYIEGFRYHKCAVGPEEVDEDGVITTDLSLEDCNGDYLPRSFAAFDRAGNGVDVMNVHACRVLERAGERRPTKQYMKCRAYVSLVYLNDTDYARGQSEFYRWITDQTFTMASGPDIEFVSVTIATNTRLALNSARLAGALNRIESDFLASSDHEGSRADYGTEPDWELIDVVSKFRDGDVVLDLEGSGS